MHLYSKATSLNGVMLAKSFESALTGETGNIYLGIGRVDDWGTKQEAAETTENLNSVFRNMFIMKSVNASDINLVVPDRLWVTDTVYDQFDSNKEMYVHDKLTEISGTVNCTFNSVEVTGNVGTLFDGELVPGDIIEFSERTNAEHAIRREVITISDNYNMNVNLAIGYDLTDNNISIVESSYPAYAKQFYVRNSYDQIFICIFNNNGGASNTEPVLRPENFSTGKLVETYRDGYVWRYLYTITSGLKEKFQFTDSEGINWIPVTTDNIVSITAVDGAIEHIRIIDGGSGFNSNTACSNVDIITISGDGQNADYFANVVSSSAIDSTTIANLLQANVGNGYSFATITTGGTGSGANLIPLISPTGGFGKDPAKDLGAKFVAVCVDVSSDISGYLDPSSAAGSIQFRQISLIHNPQYSNGTYASASVIHMTDNVTVSTFATTPSIGDLIEQQGGFKGTVVAYNAPYLLLNNTSGVFSNTAPFISGQGGTGQSISHRTIKRSGDILYIENVDAITRDSSQAEQIKLVFKF